MRGLVDALHGLTDEVGQLREQSGVDGAGAAAVTAALTALADQVARYAAPSAAPVEEIARLSAEVDRLRARQHSDRERLEALAAEVAAAREREESTPPSTGEQVIRLTEEDLERVRQLATEVGRGLVGAGQPSRSPSSPDSLLKEGLDSTGGHDAVRAFDQAAGSRGAAAPAAVITSPPRTGSGRGYVPPPRGDVRAARR